jgi:hypothetical protein
MDLNGIAGRKLPSRRKKKKAKKTPEEKPLTTFLNEDDISEANQGIRDLTQVKANLKAIDKKVEKRMKNNNEVNFYTCLVFQSWAQKMAFLEACGPVLAVDDVFIDGESFAKRFNIPIPHEEFAIIHSHLNKRLAALAKISEHRQKIKSLESEGLAFG